MDRVVAVAMRLAAAKVTGLAVGGATVLVVRTRMVRAGGETQQTAGRRLSELKESTPSMPVGSSSHGPHGSLARRGNHRRKPKGMRWPTSRRLTSEYQDLQEGNMMWMAERLSG